MTAVTTVDVPGAGVRSRRRRRRTDLGWALAAVVVVTVSIVVAILLTNGGAQLYINAAPMVGTLKPHIGPGTPFAIGLAVLVVAGGRWATGRLSWTWLMAVGYAIAVAWTWALALVDGWQQGVVAKLTEPPEYLHDLPKIGGVHDFLATFTSHIIDFQPGSWTTHVSAHPPAATLVFLFLDRLGLGGGGWAAALVITVGALAAIAVPQVVRSLGAPAAARRLLPFTVFLPGAVWVGVSADGLFAGVVAGGLALAVLGTVSRRRSWWVASAIGGLLLGLTLYLSYGLVLMGVVAAVVALASIPVLIRRDGHWRRAWLIRWSVAGAGVVVVVAVFSIAGFSWFEGLSLLHTRYYQGIASQRPYGYFVWANLAALALATGPLLFSGLARSMVVLRRAGPRVVGSASGPVGRSAAWLARAETIIPAALALSAALAVLIADFSALSKGETERIWLPFAFFLVAGFALLPRRVARWALAAQVVTALLVNHLVLTHW